MVEDVRPYGGAYQVWMGVIQETEKMLGFGAFNTRMDNTGSEIVSLWAGSGFG